MSAAQPARRRKGDEPARAAQQQAGEEQAQGGGRNGMRNGGAASEHPGDDADDAEDGKERSDELAGILLQMRAVTFPLIVQVRLCASQQAVTRASCRRERCGLSPWVLCLPLSCHLCL